jgi:hypothetical protein
VTIELKQEQNKLYLTDEDLFNETRVYLRQIVFTSIIRLIISNLLAMTVFVTWATVTACCTLLTDVIPLIYLKALIGTMESMFYSSLVES